MPEFYTYHRTSLPNGFYALDYLLEIDANSPGHKSVIKIFNKDDKLIHEIRISGEIKEMCCIKKTGLLVIVKEGSKKASIYDPMTAKLVYKKKFSSKVGALLATEDHLIVSVYDTLHILNNSTFKPCDTIKLGNRVVNKMVVYGNYLFCDVWTREGNFYQVKMYDYHTWAFLRNIGPPCVNPKIRACFFGGLTDEKIFMVARSECKMHSKIYVYCLKTGRRLNLIAIKNSGLSFICPLSLGGIAVYHDKETSKTVSVYRPLEQAPSLTDNSVYELRSQEDMALFIASKERKTALPLIKNTAQMLGKIGLFRAPIDCLIADYSVSREALEQKEVDEALKAFIIK